MPPIVAKTNARRMRDLRLPRGSAIPKVTLKNVSRLTDREVAERSKEVHVTPWALNVDANDVGAYKIVYADALHNTVVHSVAILLYHRVGELPSNERALRDLLKVPYGPQLWGSPCWLMCSCEYFKYSCEVALHRFNAADIISSNGMVPMNTNPRMVPKMCKHLYALASVAVGMKKAPSGKALPHSRRAPHPPHRGKLPESLRQKLDDTMIVPTRDELDSFGVSVKDFL